MKKNRLIQTTACAMALSAALTVSAFAATNVTATLRPDVTVRIDGVACDFYNAQGKEVHPILYNGTTYIPLRAVGELMGKSVSWDGTTQTVRLDSTTSGGDVTDFDTNDPSQSTPTGGVTLEQAKQTALQHAGKTASQVQIVKAQQDWEHGKKVYEIEFIVSGGTGYTEYDYEIDAATGKIVSYDYDAENYTPTQNTNTNVNVKISEAAAKQTALSRVPGATAANIYKFKLDFDDGRWEYEGEIRYGTMEYDFTIDANTGALLEWDMETSLDKGTQRKTTENELQRLAEKDALGKLKIFKFYEFLSSLDSTFILHLP